MTASTNELIEAAEMLAKDLIEGPMDSEFRLTIEQKEAAAKKVLYWAARVRREEV